ncbi:MULTISPECIES: PEP-CTERM sorting domain-containing protein [unclassified Calothrix]|uniref:PEP-CTERM sorting domain-containing protein n=1 Tax=unclassified Calothrix TaxID=2619626 RepID=UPI001F54F0DC|nr:MULTISPECIES: PEP-CTERM sorting domain-containing protein [unclassified Calothrix]
MTSVTFFKKLSIATAGAVLIGMGMGGTAHAAAINFDSPTIDASNGEWSLGFKFSTNKQIAINQLGFYDDLKNDLTQTHDVGIFNDAGQLLVSGTVKPGDPLDGWFRYTSVAKTILDAGQTFIIAAATGSENYTWDPVGFTVDPAINFIGDRYQSSATLVFPTDGPSVAQGYFGPNFKTTAYSVPEPLTIGGTLVAGGLGLLIKRRKTASQQASA